MNVMIVSPGHDVSTVDVYNYMSSASKALGHRTFSYDLHERMVVLQCLNRFIGGVVAEANSKVSDKRAEFSMDLFRIATEYIDTEIHRKSKGLKAKYNEGLDLIIVITGQYIPFDIIDLIKDYGAPVILYETEDPYEEEFIKEKLLVYDGMFINENINIAKYQKINPHVQYCPTACWPPIHHPYEETDEIYHYDIVFVGTGFFDRQLILERIADRLKKEGLKLGLWGYWPDIDKGSPLHEFRKGDFIPNKEAAKIYSNSTIVLNIHRTMKDWDDITPVQGNGLSPRTFEAAAIGAFQLCDDSRSELSRLFPEAATFKFPDIKTLKEKGMSSLFESADTLFESIMYWLNHPQKRAEIAKSMQEKALKHHTYINRFDEIINTVHAWR